jgi:2-dehydro-3-deoxyphosphooctonate aldolase (KDO 8-P synthase)
MPQKIQHNDSGPCPKELFFIAGPCVIESAEVCLQIARRLAQLAAAHETRIYFKASFDKANRTSVDSFRGPGLEKGLDILAQVKSDSGLAVLTDIHTPAQAQEAARVADVLQIPAFLCRQTDLIRAAAATGRQVNIKKGQFMAPQQMQQAVDKAGTHAWITERGTFFGYNRLVVDYSALYEMKRFGVPVIFDATHSVQMPGAGTGCSLGNREYILPLARAAVATGVDGLFFEIHPDPDSARCDAANTLALEVFAQQLPKLLRLHRTVTDL